MSTQTKEEKPQVNTDPEVQRLVSLFLDMEKKLNAVNLDRDEEISYIVRSILCDEHVLLIGEPGTAKSKLAKNVYQCFNGKTNIFYTLLTKYSTPEEVFGPLKVSLFKEEKYERKTEGYMPSAHFVTLDEVFKANTAILNSMLSILNERVFKNDGKNQSCPLITVIGASNELPSGDALNALRDRFLTSFFVKPLKHRSFKHLLENRDEISKDINPFITLDDLFSARKAVNEIKYSKSAENAIMLAKEKLDESGFHMSDRRWFKVVKLMKANAFMDGRQEIIQDDIVVCKHAAWKDPKDAKKVHGVIRKIENPILDEIESLYDKAKLVIDEIYKKRKDLGEEKFDRDATGEVVLANKSVKKILKKMEQMKTKVKNSPRIMSILDKKSKEISGSNSDMVKELLGM